MEKLQEIIEHNGGAKHLAEKMGVSPMAVSLWRSKGVPAQRVIQLCELSDGTVIPHDLRPDIYPDPNWKPATAS